MADNMNGLKRTHYCGEVLSANIGDEITVTGWVQKNRDLGNLVFVDLRDRTGIVQLAFDDNTEREIFEKAATVRSEFVLMAKGILRKRSSINKDIKTGEVEIFVNDLRILAKAQTPPFEIVSDTNVKEELRLKYRYLDLRRSDMQYSIMMRHKITKCARDYFDEHGFLEIETPMMIKATPEGARDYLVPSRVHPGKFFALPQSPQLYKQLLMLSGYDRYMQIARCFRDEDLRADRQPEFTQIDVEMSFIDENDVMTANEGFMVKVFKEVLNVDIKAPFKRLCYDDAMNRYGSDKPDTRFGLELIDLAEELKGCEFKVFSDALAGGGSIKGINVKGGAAALSRKEIDKLTDLAKTYKAKGVAFTRLTEEGESSSFEKFLSESEKSAIRNKMDAQTGDVLLIVADTKKSVVYDSLGALRIQLGAKLDLYDKNSFDLLWVTDFPLFEYDDETNTYAAKHHPFTSPKLDQVDKIESDPAGAYARAYDLVLNGCEVGGGSIRINDPDIQNRMFKALGFTEEEAYERFGFLLDAFKYGVPPHGGMAYGLDRLVMLMLHKDSIKEVIAFPKVQNSSELMTMCPAEVPTKDLDILGVKIDTSIVPEK